MYLTHSTSIGLSMVHPNTYVVQYVSSIVYFYAILYQFFVNRMNEQGQYSHVNYICFLYLVGMSHSV